MSKKIEELEEEIRRLKYRIYNLEEEEKTTFFGLFNKRGFEPL